MKRLFIVNPAAGRLRKKRFLDDVRKFFIHRTGEFSYVVTESGEDTRLQARMAAQSGVDQLVVLGGDGSLNAVVNGLFENGKLIQPQISVVPTNCGSGCDYYRTVKVFSEQKSWKEIAILNRPQRVDLGRVRYRDGKFSERYFINMITMGIGPAVVQGKESMPRWLPGAAKYLLPTVQQLIKYKRTPVRVVVDGEEISVRLLALFAGKGMYAGGGMKLGKNAILNDGFFDVTIVPHLSLSVLLYNLRRLYTGDFEKIEGVLRHKGKKIEVISEQGDLAIELDGDVYGHTDLEIDLVPQILNVCF